MPSPSRASTHGHTDACQLSSLCCESSHIFCASPNNCSFFDSKSKACWPSPLPDVMWSAVVVTSPSSTDELDILEKELSRKLSVKPEFKSTRFCAFQTASSSNGENGANPLEYGCHVVNAFFSWAELASKAAQKDGTYVEDVANALILVVDLSEDGNGRVPSLKGLGYSRNTGDSDPITYIEQISLLCTQIAQKNEGFDKGLFLFECYPGALVPSGPEWEAQAKIQPRGEKYALNGVDVVKFDANVDGAKGCNHYSGLSFFGERAKAALFKLEEEQRLFTSIGVDSGKATREISLLADILHPLEQEGTSDSGDRDDGKKHLLQGVSMSCFELSHLSLVQSKPLFEQTISDLLPSVRACKNFEVGVGSGPGAAKAVNVFLSEDANAAIHADPSCLIVDSVVQDSVLTMKPGSVVFGVNLSGENWTVPSGIAIFQVPLLLTENNNKSLARQFFVVGLNDLLHVHYTDERATFLGRPFQAAMAKTGMTAHHLWGEKNQGGVGGEGVPEEKRCLYNARWFPVADHLSIGDFLQEELLAFPSKWLVGKRVSLEEIGKSFHLESFVRNRRQIKCQIVCRQLESVDSGRLPTEYAVQELASTKFASSLLDSLDVYSLRHVRCKYDCSRVLTLTAECFMLMAKSRGGFRGGPAKNPIFSEAFRFFQEGDFNSGLKKMIEVRQRWLDTPTPVNLLRLSRHYERALQLVISGSVNEYSKQVCVPPANPKLAPPMDVWVTVTSPARIDVAGAWTDTPPICFDFGGAVVGMAVTLDGKRPIGCKARRVKSPVVKFILGDYHDQQKIVLVEKFSDIQDYNIPQAPGSLLKTCVIYAGIVNVDDTNTEEAEQSLKDYLLSHHGCGFELQTWSRLPQGSGLGTSSILAGCIISALWTALGRVYKVNDVIHAVLVIEQMLTTGGGWQDQVNGLLPGVKIGRSLCNNTNTQVDWRKVTAQKLNMSDKFRTDLQSHLLLIYTGKVRLAKNLLQDVVRQWYKGSRLIRETIEAHYSLALDCWSALNEENVEKFGMLLSQYWFYKRTLATGSEPPSVTPIFEALKKYTYGRFLAGAGGGGFMVVVTRLPNMKDELNELLRNRGHQASCHSVGIDEKGLEVVIGNEKPIKLEQEWDD